jgi:hypothetical protein
MSTNQSSEVFGKATGNFAVTTTNIHRHTLCGDDTLETSGGAYFKMYALFNVSLRSQSPK